MGSASAATLAWHLRRGPLRRFPGANARPFAFLIKVYVDNAVLSRDFYEEIKHFSDYFCKIFKNRPDFVRFSAEYHTRKI